MLNKGGINLVLWKPGKTDPKGKAGKAVCREKTPGA